MNKLDKQINITCITERPVTYNSLTSAYTAIRNQFNSNYCCRVCRINYIMSADDTWEATLNDKYYIDVFNNSNQLVGYLGEYNG
jgi:hypothetical protein